MAYGIHIETTGLTESGWISYVEKSEDLTISHEAVAVNPATGEKISVATPNSAVTSTGARFRPSLVDGELVITVDGPDEQTLELVKRVAKDLGGIVVGDEGEEY